MKKILSALIFFISAGSAFAQNANEQSLANKLMQEVQASVMCGASLIQARAELSRAQTRIQELEAKLAAKPDAVEKPKEE